MVNRFLNHENFGKRAQKTLLTLSLCASVLLSSGCAGGFLNAKEENVLRWVDGTLHGISSDMLDKPVDTPLGEMELLFKDTEGKSI